MRRVAIGRAGRVTAVLPEEEENADNGLRRELLALALGAFSGGGLLVLAFVAAPLLGVAAILGAGLACSLYLASE